MKRIFLIIALLINLNICLSQEISGVAEYTIKENSDEFKSSVLNDPDMDPNMRKFIESKMEKELTKNYRLTFTNNLSKFEEVTKVSMENQDSDLSWSPYGITVAVYKNLASKVLITETDLMGKIFFINDSLPTLKWQLTEQTKKIGNNLCKKATLEIPVTKEQKIAFEEEKAKFNKQSTQFFTVKEPVAKNIVAWYAPEISIMNGPLEYAGLPGLILEISDGVSTILCTKLKISPKGKEVVILPAASKTISKVKFDAVSAAKLKEVKDQN